MALKQEIINEKGAKTTYHRVSNLSCDCDRKVMKVVVKSYTSQDFRKSEKEFADAQEKRDALLRELDDLVSNPTADNEPRRIELSEQINSMGGSEEIKLLHLLETTYEIEFSTEQQLSLAEVYAWLKENVYQNAKDC